jgi:hypothetical protein
MRLARLLFLTYLSMIAAVLAAAFLIGSAGR